MKRTHHANAFRMPLLAVALSLGGLAAAQAQSMDSNSSFLPFTHKGYIGINVGRPDYKTSCGSNATLNCDNPSTSFNLYTGGMFNEYLGMELGYLNMGNADRGGGTTKAQGLNLSLMGRVPLASHFSAFAKGGATYGRTSVSADNSSGIETGSASGWGPSYGAGLGYDVATNSSVVLEWQHHDFHFAGTGRESVQGASIGFVQRF